MLTKNNNKTLFQNENINVHSECIIKINDLHDELLKEKTNYIILNNKYTELQTNFDILEKENKKLTSQVDDLLLWKKYHKCSDNVNIEGIKEDIIKGLNIKEIK
jgi:hypothetical protein